VKQPVDGKQSSVRVGCGVASAELKFSEMVRGVLMKERSFVENRRLSWKSIDTRLRPDTFNLGRASFVTASVDSPIGFDTTRGIVSKGEDTRFGDEKAAKFIASVLGGSKI
jgi:hypothetical protein